MSGYVRWLRRFIGHEPLLLVASGTIVQDDHGRILLQRRGDDGSWGIPGGALEPGETLEQAARRELLEETGLTAVDLECVDVYSGPEFFLEFPNGDQAWIVGATYLVRTVEGEIRPDGSESVELEFFAMDALPAGLNDYNRMLLDRCRTRI